MEQSMAPRRLWHVVRAVLFMLRKGMSKRRKLSMDIQLLLHRGKIAGKALGKLMTAHAHHDDQDYQPTAGKAQPPALAAYYDPRGTGLEVEFSCSNTPASYPRIQQLVPTKRRRRNNNNNSRRTHRGANGAEPGWYNYDAADIAKVFEVLNDEELLKDVVGDGPGAAAALAVLATPSPALWSSFGRSPAPVRQLRITDSPFPLRDDAPGQDGGLQVDQEADEFIKKFYDQLRTQQSLAVATPEYGYARPATGVAY